MKQFNFEIGNDSEVRSALGVVTEWVERHEIRSVLVHLYSMRFDADRIRSIRKEIFNVFPDAKIVGTSTNGDICDGHLADPGTVMAVSVFGSTDVVVKTYRCETENEIEIGELIRNEIDSCPDAAAAEILLTLKSIRGQKVLGELEKICVDIPVFGGGSANENINNSETYVLDGEEIVPRGVALVLYKGKDLHVEVQHAIGWKPLGRDLTVTRIEGSHLYELDDIPAGEIYSKYLDIQADDDFFSNILEFPIMSHQHGFEVLRMPFSCRREDGSILLAADIEKGSSVNLSYGDPEVIKEDVTEISNTLKKFTPEAIFLFSCGVRRLYWKHLINMETSPFSALAPVAGFYSSGEIRRMDKYMIEHHVTLIAVAMREGPAVKLHPVEENEKVIEVSDQEKIHGQISMVRRLATFINVTSAELRKANEELREIADTDELTGIYNRRMIEKLVHETLGRVRNNKDKIMLSILDIDDFKKVNDTYGHSVGDTVLSTIANIMKDEVSKYRNGLIGRWGGEEFLILLPGVTADEAMICMENIRKNVSETYFAEVGSKTLSIGLTECHEGEGLDEAFVRADHALYDAKESGKNRVVVHF